jgi:hypothetical protein
MLEGLLRYGYVPVMLIGVNAAAIALVTLARDLK